MQPRIYGSLLLAIVAMSACHAGSARQLLKSPAYDPKGQTTCHAEASPAQPLIVEWPSAARGMLEAIVEGHKSVAVVRYEGCTMTVLSGCTAPGTIEYVAYKNLKKDEQRITTEDELYASLPVGAASLAGKLERAGELDVDMVLIGQYEADTPQSIALADLKGTCEGATHVVRTVTVGAFDFHTGATAKVGGGAKVNVLGVGAGGSSSADEETIAEDGSVEACMAARSVDKDPPDNCGALVRLEVAPIGPPRSSRVEVGSRAPASQPSTSQWSSAPESMTTGGNDAQQLDLAGGRIVYAPNASCTAPPTTRLEVFNDTDFSLEMSGGPVPLSCDASAGVVRALVKRVDGTTEFTYVLPPHARANVYFTKEPIAIAYEAFEDRGPLAPAEYVGKCSMYYAAHEFSRSDNKTHVRPGYIRR
jgi:hypothetical protein